MKQVILYYKLGSKTLSKSYYTSYSEYCYYLNKDIRETLEINGTYDKGILLLKIGANNSIEYTIKELKDNMKKFNYTLEESINELLMNHNTQYYIDNYLKRL